jgi:hypothetical protein
VIVVVSFISGYLLSRHTDAAFPYIDSLTTWAAIWATFLVARKVLENWWYWLVIDIASIFIYWSRDLQLTSLLFVLYVIMIPYCTRDCTGGHSRLGKCAGKRAARRIDESHLARRQRRPESGAEDRCRAAQRTVQQPPG